MMGSLVLLLVHVLLLDPILEQEHVHEHCSAKHEEIFPC